MNATIETGKSVVALTDSSFAVEVLSSAKPVLVDFWAPWCGPCRMIGPVVEELAVKYQGRAVVGKVNVDDNPHVSSQFGISSIPTLLFFKNGKVVDQVVGIVSAKTLNAKLDALL